FPRPTKLTPPGVLARGVRMHMPKAIDQASIDKPLEASSFLNGEAMLPDVRPGVCEINGGVRDVKISAAPHGFVLVESFEIDEQTAVPILAVGKAAQITFGVRDIHRDHEAGGKLHGEHAALVVVAFHPQAVVYF